MSGFNVLRAYLEDKAAFTEQELAFVRSVFLAQILRSGEFLQRASESRRGTRHLLREAACEAM